MNLRQHSGIFHDQGAGRRRAVFLDRDGTINEEVDYLRDPEQLRLIPGVAQAIHRLRDRGWLTIVITNQSGIARGMFSESRLVEIHHRLRKLLVLENTEIDAIYYCPHHPTAGNAPYRRQCECRKPKTGMLERAASDFDIDLTNSVVVGDRLQDVEMAHLAGACGVLVLTGYGKTELARAADSSTICPDYTAADLPAAVDWILKQNETV